MLAKATRQEPSTKFTVEKLEAFARDLKSQRIPLDRQQISDDVETGLRAIVYKSGLIVLAVSYNVSEGNRPFLRLGTLNKDEPDHLTIEEARDLARTVKTIANRGIDVQDGLLRRLIQELQRDGVNWQPPKFEKKHATK